MLLTYKPNNLRMRKILPILALLLLTVSCGTDEDTNSSKEWKTNDSISSQEAPIVPQSEGEGLPY